MRGATVTAQQVKPDLAIVFEGSPADDFYYRTGVAQGCMKKGVQIRHMDNSYVANDAFMAYAHEIADKYDIKCQDAVRRGGSTNAGKIHVSFNVGTDPDQATIDVNNRVQLALAQLPQEVQRMGVSVLKKSSSMLQIIFLTSPDQRYNTIYLSNYALLNIVDELKRLPGVGDAKNFAAQDYSMRVLFKKAK